MILNLLSGPRNISTTLMYSFAQREDMQVMDEPFYAYHLQHHGVDHPGKAETLAALATDPDEVLAEIHQKAGDSAHLFLKNMPHHIQGIDPEKFDGFRPILLIRDPARMVVSFTKVVADPLPGDFALEWQWHWYQQLEAQGHAPVVINAHTVLSNPEKALQELCHALSLPFDSAMLSWPPGPKGYDGPWAPYWYKNVHQSTGFGPPNDAPVEVPDAYKALYLEILPFYEQLNSRALTL